LPEAAQIVLAKHKSNPLGTEYEAILREGKKFVLNIGAGTRRRAAAEILRVSKLSSLAIHTAFLQPLHEAPLHFYNATEHGVRLVQKRRGGKMP
jgi:hypothetical protein